MNCKNCGHFVDSKFCGHCGQKSNVSRISLSNFLTDLSESFFQINRGFFYTLKELFARPGAALNEFLNGKRKSHFKPIAYLITLSTVYYIISQITNQDTWIGDIIRGWTMQATEQDSNAEIPEIATWFLKNYAYSILLLLPVFSLASYIAFLKFDKNYLEHIVINSYITGHQAIFYSLFVIGRAFVDSVILEVLPLVFAVSYTFWVFWQFFSEGNRAKNVLRTVLTYMLYCIFCLLLLAALLVIYK